MGVSHVLLNYVDGLVKAGVWILCSGGGSCDWSERWRPTGTPLIYSTADNSRPAQARPPDLSFVRLGLLLPMFRTRKYSYRPEGWWAQSSRSAAVLAFRAINNKRCAVDHA